MDKPVSVEDCSWLLVQVTFLMSSYVAGCPGGLPQLVSDCLHPAPFPLIFMISAPTSLPERKLVESSRKVSSRPKPLSILRSLEEKYVAAMKKLQFGEFKYFLWDVCRYIFLFAHFVCFFLFFIYTWALSVL